MNITKHLLPICLLLQTAFVLNSMDSSIDIDSQIPDSQPQTQIQNESQSNTKSQHIKPTRKKINKRTKNLFVLSAIATTFALPITILIKYFSKTSVAQPAAQPAKPQQLQPSVPAKKPCIQPSIPTTPAKPAITQTVTIPIPATPVKPVQTQIDQIPILNSQNTPTGDPSIADLPPELIAQILAESKLLEQKANQRRDELDTAEINKGLTQDQDEVYPRKIWEEIDNGNPNDKIHLCDKRNKEYKFETTVPNIIQIPCLYQAYPGLPDNYCGYYAAFFALCMIKWNGKSIIDLINALNDRTQLDFWLPIWVNAVRTSQTEKETANFYEIKRDFIGSGEIKETVIPSINNHTAINDANILIEGYDFERKDLSRPNSKISVAITNFKKPGNLENLCFIYNTSLTGSHWITILVTRKKTLIIADPLATNRTDFDYITQLYQAIF